MITIIPGKDIYLYSESKSNVFEPPEFRKGDIARSMFYFYTFYQPEADKKSKTFFSSMLPDLCRWHRSDKADSTEILRSFAIARIQANANPFIFDPSLVERCYCSAYPDKPIKSYAVNIYPNPSKGLFYIDIPDYKGPIILKISDASGKLHETHHLMYSGLMSWRLVEGLYILNLLLTPSINQKVIVLIVD
ncbi:MAG: endonuclease [Saprospiraceae bacterium]|nr:endonuclease [Saprospiraceae bacterium]